MASLILRSLLSHGFYHWKKKNGENPLPPRMTVVAPTNEYWELKVAFVMSMMDDDDHHLAVIMINWKTLKLILERNFNVSCRMNFCLSGAG